MTRAHHRRLAHRIRSRLKLQPGEGVRLSLMMLYAAAAFGGVDTVGSIVSNALFLSRLPSSAVPYVFILPAIGIILALLLYSRFSARFRLNRTVIGSTLLMALLVLLLRLLLNTPYGNSFPVLTALYLLIEIAFVLVVMQFWIFAGRVFDLREARRLFGVMMVGGTLASITAGFFLAEAVELVGAENLLFLIAIALLVCTFCAWAVGRVKTSKYISSATNVSSQATSLHHDLGAILRSPLLRAIAELTVLLALLTNIGAYGFYLALQASYAGREDAMVVFLGRFEFFAGLAALFVQAYLTGHVLRRSGVFAALLFFPLAIAFGAGLGLVTGGALFAMTLILASNIVFRDTINDTALNILYLPIPGELRERTKELFETLFALTVGLAGVAFLIMQRVPGWSYAYWSIPLLVLALGFIVLLLRARRYYLQALRDNVSKRQLDLNVLPMDVTDETTKRVLTEALKHPDELMVLHALKLIAEAPGGDWSKQVTPLLTHPSREVKLEALRYVERCTGRVPLESVKSLFTSPEKEVHAAALITYCALGGNASEVTTYLHEMDPRVKGAAVLGLATYGDAESRRLAILELETMLVSHDPSIRSEAVHLIGALKLKTYETRLFFLFKDENLEVQRGAIRAAGALQSYELLPTLLDRLTNTIIASDTIEAIASYGAPALPVLNAVLANREGDGNVRARVPAILQRIGSLAAADILLSHLAEPDGSVRLAIYKALVRLQGHLDFAPPIAPFQEVLSTEIASAYALHAIRHDLKHPTPLLNDALKTHLEAGLERIFLLLELRYPGELGRAYWAIKADDADGNALAIELLDTLLDREIKATLLPLFEASAQGILEIAYSRFGLTPQPYEQRIEELATGADLWLQACAVFEIGALGKSKLNHVALAALNSQNPLLRETALASCRSLLEPRHFQEVLRFHATADPSPKVSTYAKMLLEIQHP